MGLEHRELGTLRALGVNKIHIWQSHKFLTLAYQIEADCVRPLWVGKDRTMDSFERFFSLIGHEMAGEKEFVCTDIWRPCLKVIARHCPRALNILDRFHMAARLNKALDEVRAGEARRMVREGYEPVLKKKRWCMPKRPENLTDNRQRSSLREMLPNFFGRSENPRPVRGMAQAVGQAAIVPHGPRHPGAWRPGRAGPEALTGRPARVRPARISAPPPAASRP